MSVEPPLDTQDLIQRAVHHQVRLPEYSQPVYIEDAQSIDDLVSLAVRTRDGQTEQIIIPAVDLADVLDQTLQQDVKSNCCLDVGCPGTPLSVPGKETTFQARRIVSDLVSLNNRFCLSQ
jgi:hypothetical protein